MEVYKAINAVQRDLVKTGIQKKDKNSFDNYMFRGIDAVYNALSPLLAEHGLCIMPRVLSRSVTKEQSAKGGVLFYVVLDVEFDFVCANDGSKHTIKTYGEAMDRGDKATNKAMSAAYKYAAFQTFAIPTEADNDPDNSSHEISGDDGGKKAIQNGAQKKDNGRYDMSNGPAATMTQLRDMAKKFRDDLAACDERAQAAGLCHSSKALIDQIKADLPGWWTGEGEPPEFVPIKTMMDRMNKEFDKQEARNAA